MFPMSCPSCGRKGNIPLDRLNTRMHCKKCDAIFHLDATGKPLLGEPPSVKGTKGAKGARSKNEPLDPIGIVAAKLAKTPKPIWMTLLILMCGGVIYLASGLFGPGPRPANADFLERNLAAAVAFIDRDVATMQKFATQDSRAEVATLIETFRPMVGDPGGKATSYEMKPVAGLPEQMTDEPVIPITIQPPAEIEGDSAPPIFMLDLVWIKGNNRYYLNGKATLETNEARVKARNEAKAAEEAKKKKR